MSGSKHTTILDGDAVRDRPTVGRGYPARVIEGGEGGGTRVSVVIPNWNGGDMLAEVLRGLEEQEFDSFEVIVVDDASTDGSARACTAGVSSLSGGCARAEPGLRRCVQRRRRGCARRADRLPQQRRGPRAGLVAGARRLHRQASRGGVRRFEAVPPRQRPRHRRRRRRVHLGSEGIPPRSRERATTVSTRRRRRSSSLPARLASGVPTPSAGSAGSPRTSSRTTRTSISVCEQGGRGTRSGSPRPRSHGTRAAPRPRRIAASSPASWRSGTGGRRSSGTSPHGGSHATLPAVALGELSLAAQGRRRGRRRSLLPRDARRARVMAGVAA